MTIKLEYPPHKKLYQDIFDWCQSSKKLPLESEMDDLITIIKSSLTAQQPVRGDVNVPLERVKRVLDFYANRNHWMGQSADDIERRVLIAMMGGHDQNGYNYAESVQDDLWALEQLINNLERTRDEAMATIDRMNEEKALTQLAALLGDEHKPHPDTHRLRVAVEALEKAWAEIDVLKARLSKLRVIAPAAQTTEKLNGE